MTDAETLVLVLVVVYLLECLFWVRPEALVFRRFWRRSWKLVVPTEFLANARGFICWSNPLPPFGAAHIGRTFPFCVSPEGVRIGGVEVLASANVTGPSVGTFYPFATLATIDAQEKKLRLNQALVWRSDSVHQPAAWADLLRDLKQRPSAARATCIRDELTRRFNVRTVTARRQEFALRCRSLQILNVLLFLVLFAACPAAVWLVGLRTAAVPMVLVIFALTIASGVLFRRQHKYFYPQASDDRLKLTMLTLLVPAVSIRARELLGRSLLEAFHPLAVAQTTLSADAFKLFARRCWRELKYPFGRPAQTMSPEADAAESWFRAELLRTYEIFLAEHGVSERVWLQAPTPIDTANTLFCPRCESQFTSQARDCASCGGLSLEKLAINNHQ